MAAVDLTELWIHDAADLSDATRVRVSAASESTVIAGEVRRRAGGRRQLVTRPGADTQLTVTTAYVSRDVVDAIRARIGQRVMVRDDRGRVMWGAYLAVNIVEWIEGRAESVTFSVVMSGTQTAEV